MVPLASLLTVTDHNVDDCSAPPIGICMVGAVNIVVSCCQQWLQIGGISSRFVTTKLGFLGGTEVDIPLKAFRKRGIDRSCCCYCYVLACATTVSLSNVDQLNILHVKSHSSSNVHLGVSLSSLSVVCVERCCNVTICCCAEILWQQATTCNVAVSRHIIIRIVRTLRHCRSVLGSCGRRAFVSSIELTWSSESKCTTAATLHSIQHTSDRTSGLIQSWCDRTSSLIQSSG
jgi:hypothetical protein